MDVCAEASKKTQAEVDALREKVTVLTNQLKEMASPEGIDEIVQEGPYIIAGVALVVGIVVGPTLVSVTASNRSRWQ